MRVIQDCTHFLGWEGVWKGRSMENFQESRTSLFFLKLGGIYTYLRK